MADVSSGKFFDKSYNERTRSRERTKDYLQSSYSKKYNRDIKPEFPTSERTKEYAFKDDKYKSYNRCVEDTITHHSRPDRRGSYRSEDKHRHSETNQRSSTSHEDDNNHRFSESSHRYPRHAVKNEASRIPIPNDDDKSRYSDNSHGYSRFEPISDGHHNSTPEDASKVVRYPDTYHRTRYENHTNFDDRFHNSRSPHRASFNAERYHDGFAESGERRVSYNSKVSDDNEHVSSLCQKIEFLNNKVELLSQENEKLKCCLSGNRNNVDGNSMDEVNIVFFNKNLEELFLPILQEVTSDLIRGKLNVTELQDFLSSKKDLIDKQEDWTEIPEGDLFSLDNSTAEQTDAPYVPQYNSSFSEILQDDKAKDQNKGSKNQSKRKSNKSCFNCSEDHFITDCPYRINQQKVAFAKKQLQKTFYAPTVRYHVQGLKESDYKPGVISDNLRNALGLASNQVPLHIYNMRLLDYPPGWHEETAVESSGIALYGSDGFAQDTGNNSEFNRNENSVQFDKDKLVSFPGFNVPLPPDVIDECYELGLPPMQAYHLRSVVEQGMSKPDVCPKRKRKFYTHDDNSAKFPRLEEDMDVEELDEVPLEFNPPLPEDAPPPPPPDELPDEEIEPTFSPAVDSDSQSGANTPMSDSIMEALAPVVERFDMNTVGDMSSPSLKQLEELKKRLVMELGMDSRSSSPISPGICLGTGEESDSANPNSRDFTPNDGEVRPESVNDLSSFSDCSFNSNPNTSSLLQRTDSRSSASKCVTLGTPSLSRHSSYRKLPDYDNFAKDVTSHLNFENLPNSTGTYEKMKKVIKKVKEKINSFMQ